MGSMITVNVPCLHGYTERTLDHARAILLELAKAIEAAEREVEGGLRLTDDKYLSRRDIYDFFGQMMPEGAVRNHACKLFAAIVRSSIRNERLQLSALPLVILCGECMQPLSNSDRCAARGMHNHYENEREYLICVESLKECEETLLLGGPHKLTGAKFKDFMMLMEAIRGK